MVYLFDIDGTLTPPRQKMDGGFLFFFLSWMEGKKVFLVGGSDLEKVHEQIPRSVSHRCEGIFCCMGNEFWQKDKIIYQNNFDPAPRLREMLTSFQMYTKFPIKAKVGGRGAIFEFRTGMLNFTTIGRNADSEERNKYYEWDKKSGERIHIAQEVEKSFPDLEARLGGQISIDIQPKGYNKSQASKWVRENVDKDILFIGDKCMEGGNDSDIYLDVKNNKGSVWQVGGFHDTMEVLARLAEGEVSM